MALFKTFSISKKTSSKVRERKTSPATAERIKNILGIRHLETMPAQAARAFQLASDAKSRAQDFINIIESDEALSAKVIRVANSVYFYRGTQALDIEKAVANIGLDELRCLLSAAMLKSLLAGKNPIRDQIWANSVATAIAAKNLTRYLDNIPSSEAFLCGLLHDVGKLVMVRKSGKLYEKVFSIANSEDLPFTDAEDRVFELNHIEVGQWVAEQWHFPLQVKEAIIGHHQPWPTMENDKGRNTKHAILIKCADTIAHAAAIGQPSHIRQIKLRAERELVKVEEQLCFSIEDKESFIKDFVKQFDNEFGLYQIEGSN
jgi:putative nucleotidyltransferase with HDIG domain